MTADEIFSVLRAENCLPTLPSVATRVLELFGRDDVSPIELAKPISSDPALATRVLKFANSPSMGACREVSSLPQAVALLGTRRVSILALSFSLISLETKNDCSTFDFDEYWSRSLATAVAAKVLAEQVRHLCPDQGFLGGLLSHIGQLSLAVGVPHLYEQVLEFAETEACEVVDAEQHVLGCTHDEIATRLLNEWHFPRTLCQAVSRNTDYPGDESGNATLSCLLLASEQAAFILRHPSSQGAGSIAAFANEASKCLRIDVDAVKNVYSDMAAQWGDYGDMLDIKTNDVRSFTDIETDAKEQLARFSLSVVRENETLKHQQSELWRMAYLDKLTQIANRAAFDERLALEIERCEQTKQPLSLLFIDVDHFKAINDSVGHQRGDQVLQAIADVLRKAARSVDLVARYGGDEFAIILLECQLDGAVRLAGRVQDAVTRERSHLQPLKVSVSIGASFVRWPDRALSAEELVGHADELLYAAKREGRGRVKAVHPSGNPESGGDRHGQLTFPMASWKLR